MTECEHSLYPVSALERRYSHCSVSELTPLEEQIKALQAQVVMLRELLESAIPPCIRVDENNDYCRDTFTCWPCQKRQEIRQALSATNTPDIQRIELAVRLAESVYEHNCDYEVMAVDWDLGKDFQALIPPELLKGDADE